jgi:hypothetical protein
MSTTASSEAALQQDIDEMGPIDFIVIEFPRRAITGEGMLMLVDLVDRGIIRVLDLAFIVKDADGSVRRLDLSELGQELGIFEGASSGLFDEEDLRNAAEALSPDTGGALLLYENRWAAPLATTLRRNGAQLVAAERLPVQAILAALDAAESK